jgi:hypothetical protein
MLAEDLGDFEFEEDEDFKPSFQFISLFEEEEEEDDEWMPNTPPTEN